MSAKASYFKLGLFILSSIAILTVAIIVLSNGIFSDDRATALTVFDTSVQGLDTSAKVKFRGVQIGTVTGIDLLGTKYKTDSANATAILVTMSITKPPFALSSDATGKTLDDAVKKGLRARMASQGITGICYIDLDYLDPERHPVEPINWTPDHPVIPSASSTLTQIVDSAEEFFAQVSKINFQKLSTSLQHLATTLQTKLDQLPVDKISTQVLSLTNTLNTTATNIRTIVSSPRTESTLADITDSASALRTILTNPKITDSINKLEQSIAKLDQLISNKNDNIDTTLFNLRIMSENLKTLSEDLSQNPSQLIKAPPPQHLQQPQK